MRPLSIKNLENLQEWSFYQEKIKDLIVEYTDDMVIAAGQGDVPKVQYCAGRVSMLKELLALPEVWMPEPGRED